MRERTVEDHLNTSVRAAGGEVRKVRWIGRRHAPDRLVLLNGHHPLVELKRPGKGATPGQRREHERLRLAGFRVEVLNSCREVDLFMLSLLGGE